MNKKEEDWNTLHRSLGRAALSPLLLLAISLVIASGASAQAADNTREQQLERLLIESLNRIEQLEARVLDLEKHSSPTASAPPSAANAPAVAEPVRTFATKATSIPLHGFADAGFGAGDHGGVDGFRLGVLDLYLTPRLSDHVLGLVELVFEFDQDGNVVTELERLQAGYIFSDAATVWLGRFHSPYGTYNATYHHGSQLQTAINRPRFLDFEDRGGFLPVHSVGLWANGSAPLGQGRLFYDAYLSNEPLLADGELGPQNVGNSAGSVGGGLNLHYALNKGPFEGLGFGVSGYSSAVRDASGNRVAKLNFMGVHAVYETDRWEILSEAYQFFNRTAVDDSQDSWAAFLQVGYRSGLWTPFARVERARLSSIDPYFLLQDMAFSYRRAAVGVRYDLTPHTALKLEVDRTHNVAASWQPRVMNDVSLQWAVRF